MRQVLAAAFGHSLEKDAAEMVKYYNIKAVIPGDESFQPLNQSRCPLVAKK